jgi:hypothetical protein
VTVPCWVQPIVVMGVVLFLAVLAVCWAVR